MKKTMENEKGYALLVVLFLIVFIITVSAVFMRGSLSNAKQEQRVDQNHLSVVAAEMGVDYYVGKINNEERKIQEEALNSIRSDLNILNKCGGEPNPGKLECKSIKPIDTIMNDVKVRYLEGINNLVVQVKKSGETNIDLYSSETHKVEASPYSYQVVKEEVSWLEKNGKLIIELGINGKSQAERPKFLKTNISYEIPKFVLRKTSAQESQTANPTNIYDFFKKKSDYEKKSGCSAQNGHCSPGKFYSENKLSVNKPNNQGGLIWIHNGYLEVGQMNQFNFTLIVKSLEVQNMNQMKGKLVLLGGENQTGKIPQDISVKFQSSGKLCVNVDGFSKSDLEKISFDKAAHVYFFSSKDNPVWPNKAINSPKVTGSLVNFVNDCIGQPLIEMESTGVYYYEAFESSLDLLVDVKY